MNTIPAQEIKRRGISAVDDLLAKGPVHVISHNRPSYVVMDEARYQLLLEGEEERLLAQWEQVKRDVANGDVTVLRSDEEIRAWVSTLGSVVDATSDV